MTTVQNPIDQIEARLDGGRLWHKGGLGTGSVRDPDASLCVLGATWAALGLDGECTSEVENLLTSVTEEQYPDRLVGGSSWSVANFNDHKDTVFSDIEDIVLPKARQLYEDRLAGL